MHIADSTGLPVMLYDIPGRSGVPFSHETLVRLGEHPRIVANKDAKGDLGAAAWAIARSDLAWYSGDDILTLPLLSVGAVGVVSVVGHLVASELRTMIDAFAAGDTAKAVAVHQSLLPVFSGMFRTQGVILTKAALELQKLPGGPLRLPLVGATPEEIEQLKEDLAAAWGTPVADADVRAPARRVPVDPPLNRMTAREHQGLVGNRH